MRNAYKILVGKPEGKRPLRRARRGWEDNIKMNFKEIVWEDDWIQMVQERDALVNAVLNFTFR
jgi:hypothetical protein